jgi:hypothetical protein
MLLCTTSDDQWKKWIDFNVEIKLYFEWQFWMTLQANWIELKWNEILVELYFNTFNEFDSIIPNRLNLFPIQQLD